MDPSVWVLQRVNPTCMGTPVALDVDGPARLKRNVCVKNRALLEIPRQHALAEPIVVLWYLKRVFALSNGQMAGLRPCPWEAEGVWCRSILPCTTTNNTTLFSIEYPEASWARKSPSIHQHVSQNETNGNKGNDIHHTYPSSVLKISIAQDDGPLHAPFAHMRTGSPTQHKAW